jgi:hypothetical protein
MRVGDTEGEPDTGRSHAGSDMLVLGTVNAPFKREIDLASLIFCLKTGKVSPWLVHIVTFLTEVEPGLVFRFANAHGIPASQIALVYRDVKTATGMQNLNMEVSLVSLAKAA